MVLRAGAPRGADALSRRHSWAEVEARLRELLRRQPEARPYVLGVTANATEVVPDKQGRILVPQRLLEAAGLEARRCWWARIDRVEIWDPDALRGGGAGARPEFERFASQIFA